MRLNLTETELLTVKLAIITAVARNHQPIKKSTLHSLVYRVATPSIINHVIRKLLMANPPILLSEVIEGRIHFSINQVSGHVSANHL